MQLRVGTSGFSYPKWRGSFYPEDLKERDMLRFYGERFPSVEINNTFYRMPKPEVLESWAEQVPPEFAFTLKATRRITHIMRLREIDDEVRYLYEVAGKLGPKRGPILFQLPPNLRKDIERLNGLLSSLPSDHRAVLEFRHESWLDDEVYAALRVAGAVLCCADAGDEAPCKLVATGSYGYLRLRREDYDDAALATWVERIRAQPWTDAYVYFKHEDEGVGPRLAARFRELFEAA